MAARKLQAEVDKCLKKVAEGVELFEDTYSKMQSTTHQQQKMKQEEDLKSQIKKLQRLRDQIKTWLASNEIKDKTLLIDNRKLIETQMERFKACEKEMKTKAFSKEGLSLQAKLDPKEQLKVEMTSWVSSMVDELGRQVEQAEAEIESIAGTRKKNSKAGSGRTAELEQANDRRKWHIGRLELMLRSLENGNLEPEDVANVKEDIAYFVESNSEEDFEEDEGIYDELHLDEEEEAFGMGGDEVLSSHDSHSVADTSDIVTNSTPSKPSKEVARSKPPVVAEEVEKSPNGVKHPATKPARKTTLESQAKPSAAASSAAKPTPVVPSQPAATAPQPRTAPIALPTVRYSVAAAAAVSQPAQPVSSPSATTAATTIPPVAGGILTGGVKVTPAGSSVPLPPITSPPASSGPSHDETADASKAAASDATLADQVASPRVTPAPTPTPQLQHVARQESPALSSALPTPTSQHPPHVASPENQSAALPGRSPSVVQPVQDTPAGFHPGLPQNQGAQPSQYHGEPARLPSSLADLVTSFESAKQKSLKRDGDINQVSKILEAGYSNVPQSVDADKPKYYVPKSPYPTAFYYPQAPLQVLETPALFSKFDVDTLFYIFYYQVGTYMQYLAAEELKRRAWRFHKQYLTWFQRANEPQAITDEYEQGVYLYFDWETAWSTRRKNSFTFNYKYLEDGE